MTAIDFIKLQLKQSYQWTMALANDVKEIPLMTPTTEGGNHPLWCIGHVAYSQAKLFSTITGEPNTLSSWEGIFKAGTTPVADASLYPSYEEVLQKFEETHAAIVAFVSQLNEEDLERESFANAEMKDWIGTMAQCLSLIAIHPLFHCGQIADVRRAAHRQPLLG